MTPTEEEKQKIQEAQLANPDVPLGTAEQFLLTLSSISALTARLQLWAFKLNYETLEKVRGGRRFVLSRSSLSSATLCHCIGSVASNLQTTTKCLCNEKKKTLFPTGPSSLSKTGHFCKVIKTNYESDRLHLFQSQMRTLMSESNNDPT